MSEMIERVARAFWDKAHAGNLMANPDQFWDEADKSSWRAAAKLAIAAMREPTVDMALAAYPAWDAFGENPVLGPEEVLAIWRAMIEAALK